LASPEDFCGSIYGNGNFSNEFRCASPFPTAPRWQLIRALFKALALLSRLQLGASVRRTTRSCVAARSSPFEQGSTPAPFPRSPCRIWAALLGVST
jgi:hypothetical protein